jgi:hypothetical protein
MFVDTWLQRSATGLSPDQLIALFEKALGALQIRILKTLSEVTLNAILDRILHQCQQQFPLLTEVKIEAHRISLTAVAREGTLEHPNEIRKAFRLFLIELLTVMGNLTAGILTKALYKTLSDVTFTPTKSIPPKGEDL